jgi:hypothetical protein
MAERIQTGAAINTERKVTHNELTINGKKPNFPCMGFHSDSEINLKKDCSCRIGSDFTYRQTASNKGISKRITNEMSIQK